MGKVFKYMCQKDAYLSLCSNDNMIRATRTCVLIALAFLAQVESGYEYQLPRVAYQQPNQHFVEAGQSNVINGQQSVSYSSVQGNYIGQQNNGQYQQSSYQNSLNHNHNYNGFSNNIQSGYVSQNLQQTNSISAQPVQPIVTKHIYFHVPPPEEERPVQPPVTVNRKKTYNIIFIKVPAQRPNYFVNSQGVRSNPYAAVEDKTLIYVLVKNPEDQSKVLPKKSAPNHEVFYVKYKGSATDAVSQISSGASQQNSVESLRPGLVNGQ